MAVPAVIACAAVGLNNEGNAEIMHDSIFGLDSNECCAKAVRAGLRTAQQQAVATAVRLAVMRIGPAA
jgi:hypothetical protein